jgi:hypothetical protein
MAKRDIGAEIVAGRQEYSSEVRHDPTAIRRLPDDLHPHPAEVGARCARPGWRVAYSATCDGERTRGGEASSARLNVYTKCPERGYAEWDNGTAIR